MFNHETRTSRLRRLTGLSDKQWDTLTFMLSLHLKKEGLVHDALIDILKYDNFPEEIHNYVAEIMGYNSPQTSIRPSVRFFRHFCPENIRYPVNRSLMPSAMLVYDGFGNVQWVSEKTMLLLTDSDVADASVGTTITIRMEGRYQIDRIAITSTKARVIYDGRGGDSLSFGDAIFTVKKLISQNRRRKLELQQGR